LYHSTTIERQSPTVEGHVSTPDGLAERMVRRLFERRPPTASDRILYPGCGAAPFPAAVERVCGDEGWPLPDGVGVEADPGRLAEARARDLAHVDLRRGDFLAPDGLDVSPVDFVVGNPPYVPIEGLNEDEKERYRAAFDAAVGRFDLSLLFFERSLALLRENGRLVFVTPEKFEYVATAEPLRRLLTAADTHVERIEHLDEDTFGGHVAFPCVTTVQRGESGPTDGSSRAPSVRGHDSGETGATLGDVTVRISPGMATGADSVFVSARESVPPQLSPDWTRPTVSGRQLTANDGPRSDEVLICPYRDDGTLPPEDELGAFGEWAELHRSRLEERSCVTDGGKPWYAWHETPPMDDLLRPKIVFKDIAEEPRFRAEREGDVVPRHSVYYPVPEVDVPFDDLLAYLNGPDARMWMRANCQKAANGFLRLQSRVLRDLPVPVEWVDAYQATL
jgi:SAM-dependent methyltransferase